MGSAWRLAVLRPLLVLVRRCEAAGRHLPCSPCRRCGRGESAEPPRLPPAPQYLASSVEGVTLSMLSLLPSDYEVFLARAKTDFPTEAGKHASNVFVTTGIPGTAEYAYVGGTRQFEKWAHSNFGYVDKTNNKMLYERMAKVHMRSVMEKSGHTFVFMDVAVDGRTEGQMILELYDDVCMKTVENFVALCKGCEQGIYRNSPFHRIVEGGWIQGGDVVDGSGKHGKSVFGGVFADETFAVTHNQAGILGMANYGPHTNGSQFYITLAPLPYLDGKKVAFGRVIDGLRVLKVLGKLPTENERPTNVVTIADCGMYTLAAAPAPAKDA